MQRTPAPGPADAPVRSTVEWNSWHLHLASAARSTHDRVVTDVIGPVVDSLAGAPWFFLRYWQAGPHLRLRIGGLDPGGRDAVERELTERLAVAGRLADGEEPVDPASYARSAHHLAGAEDYDPADVAALAAPGVHCASYQPEFDRYGGPELMPATERLFAMSSELVLAFLASRPPLRARAIMALRGTMAVAAALGSGADQAHYYAHGLREWYGVLTRYGYSADQLDRFCGLARDSLGRRGTPPPEPETPTDHGPFARWHGALAELVGAIPRYSSTHPGQVVFSHAHMLHNRLGLGLAEELQTYARLSHLFPPAGPPG